MKNLILLVLLMFLVTGFTQDKVKVQLKKGFVLVNKTPWSKYEFTAGKYFISNLAGEEFVSINSQSYGSGRFDKNTGREILSHYSEVHFFKTEIELFEVDPSVKVIIELFQKEQVLANDVFNLENARAFKNKYAEKISERVFRTK